MKKIHPVAGALALVTLVSFWLSTAFSELAGGPEVITAVKSAIPYGLLLLIPALAVAGASGMKLGAEWKSPLVVAKKKRMPFIALNGILVLIPSCFVLRHLAINGDFGPLFYAVQALELAAGAVNIVLLTLNMRDGLRMRLRRRITPAAP
ncbi:MAG: hypothetical protein LCH47_03205 [Proteobacteria bacterium]|nr:hypothetical protein [Pseudomonadota bacterium]